MINYEKIETWLDVTITDECIFISDWTHTMQFIGEQSVYGKDVNVWKRMYRNYSMEFTTVVGVMHTYHIRGLGLSYEQCKAIAIKYHVAKQSGTLSKHRLD